MSLFPCVNCGRMVSNSAMKCPQCGKHLNAPLNTNSLENVGQQKTCEQDKKGMPCAETSSNDQHQTDYHGEKRKVKLHSVVIGVVVFLLALLVAYLIGRARHSVVNPGCVENAVPSVDDRERLRQNGWDIQKGDWGQTKDGIIFSGNGSNSVAERHEENLDSFEIQAGVMDGDMIGLRIEQNDFGIQPRDECVFWQESSGLRHETHQGEIKRGRWHTLRIDLAKDSITFYVDDGRVVHIDRQDASNGGNRFVSKPLALVATSARALFRNIRVERNAGRQPTQEEIIELHKKYLYTLYKNMPDAARNICWKKTPAERHPTTEEWQSASTQWCHLGDINISVTAVSRKHDHWIVDVAVDMNMYPLPMRSQGTQPIGGGLAFGTCKTTQYSKSAQWEVLWDGGQLKFNGPLEGGLY